MHDVHEFLRSLTVVLAVAAVTTVVFQRLRQPVALGYIIAGLIVGPHVPLPLVADPRIVTTLSELGVILLMFSLGLEFSLAKLVRVGPEAGVTAAVQCIVMFWLGFLVGELLGWTTLESVFMGAAIAISSTTIIAKVFDEENIGGRWRELVIGILLVEDLIAIVFMAVLTAVAAGSGVSAGALAGTLARLAGFLAILLAVGMVVVPRFIRLVVGLGRAETTLVASIGVCFATAYVAQVSGYSVALGAFLAGSLVAESGHAEEIEHLIHPVRDLFAAIFFVSVGMLIDPALALQHWGAIVVLTVVVIVGTIVSVTAGAFLAGAGLRTAVRAGMSLAQIGEFSFIIATLGLTLGATRDFLYPVAVAVAAITTMTTPWLIRGADRAAELVDRKLPHRLQTVAALYGAWLSRGRAAPATEHRNEVRRLWRLLAVDVALLIVLVLATAVWLDRAAAALTTAVALADGIARLVVLVAAMVLALPLVLGVGRVARRLGGALAERALPRPDGKADFDAAPRRTLTLTLQLATTVGAGLVVVVVTQRFLPSYSGPLLLLLAVAGFGFAIWRSATDLESHVRAGAQAIIEVLSAGAASVSPAGPRGAVAAAVRAPDPAVRPIEIPALVPTFGAPTAIQLQPSSGGVGRSLAELNLRGATGASVIAIVRPGASVVVPDAHERLVAGDVLALTGTQDAVDAAKALLLDGPPR